MPSRLMSVDGHIGPGCWTRRANTSIPFFEQVSRDLSFSCSFSLSLSFSFTSPSHLSKGMEGQRVLLSGRIVLITTHIHIHMHIHNHILQLLHFQYICHLPTGGQLIASSALLPLLPIPVIPVTYCYLLVLTVPSTKVVVGLVG